MFTLPRSRVCQLQSEALSYTVVATGFGLAAASLGTSLILSAIGGAICVGGGATVAGSSIVQSKLFKTKLATAQEVIDADRKAQEPVQKLLDDLCREVSKESFGSVKNCLASLQCKRCVAGEKPRQCEQRCAYNWH